MQWTRVISTLLLALLPVLAGSLSCDAEREPEVKKTMKAEPSFTILFDNVPYTEGYRTSWGYSCLVRGFEKTILFDTGGDGGILLDNMGKAGVDPGEIDVIVLSHSHGDHTGGLRALLPRCRGVTVYLLASFPQALKDEARSLGAEVVEVSGPVAIADGVQTTGSLGYQIPEQSLAIEIPGGIVVVTGCAHPGLVGICERVREIAGPGPMFVMGGFHLGEFSRADVESLVESLRAVGVRAVMPTHCTGGAARHTLKTIFGKSYLEGGAGRVLRTKEIQAALDGGD